MCFLLLLPDGCPFLPSNAAAGTVRGTSTLNEAVATLVEEDTASEPNPELYREEDCTCMCDGLLWGSYKGKGCECEDLLNPDSSPTECTSTITCSTFNDLCGG